MEISLNLGLSLCSPLAAFPSLILIPLIHILLLKGVSVGQESEVPATFTMLSQGFKVLEYPRAPFQKLLLLFVCRLFGL